MRPALPTFDRLEPYLRRIDAMRTYSNFGPLVQEFISRASELLGMPNCLAAASSGTAALTAAILATAGRAKPDRPYAVVPAYTFVATALAVELCGYRPLVAEIDARDWMLSPERALALARRGDVGLVVPVAPYGRAFDQTQWRRFRETTGIPVVIDAAASFDVLAHDRTTALAAIGDVPVALSFHATKSFSTGEGGGVVSTDPRVLLKVAQTLNLGFAGSRDCGIDSFNGKLSEYHAAVGLAELDGWKLKRDASLRVASAYRHASVRTGLGDRIKTAPAIAGCYVLFEADSASDAGAVAARLTEAGIGSRFWYGEGIHRHAHFADVDREDVSTAEDVASRVLGLPMSVDYTSADIDSIVDIVTNTVAVIQK